MDKRPSEGIRPDLIALRAEWWHLGPPNTSVYFEHIQRPL
jgi:hypothetical protein